MLLGERRRCVPPAAGAVSVLLAVALVLAGLPEHPTAAAQGTGTALGVYDPDGDWGGYRQVTLEAAYVGWEPNGAAALTQAVQAIRARERTPILYLDTYPFTWLPGYSPDDVLPDIIGGRYDRSLTLAARAAAADGRLLYLVWGQEMERCGAHIWSTCQSQVYVDAYRHIVTVFRRAGASNVRFVWAPAGEPGAVDYYPGDAYVDVVGFSLFLADQWSMWASTRRQPFADAVAPYFALLGRFGKPFLIVQFGLATDEPQDQRDYLIGLAPYLAEFPSLCGLVYFNNPATGDAESSPNFKLSPETARAFVEAFRPGAGPPAACR